MGSIAVHPGLDSGFRNDHIRTSYENGTPLDIPQAYEHLLEPIEILDSRTDDEILESLTKFVPVTSEKNVWAFWNTGLRSMPSWNKRNVIDWVRICGKSGWTIRVLDSVSDSPNFAAKYLDSKLLPEAYNVGTMGGPWAGQHSADFVRGASLWSHGGICMDVGCVLLRDLDRVCWNKMTEPGSPYHVAAPHLSGQRVANYFIACRKGDPFIKRWHDLFVHLWTGHTTAQGLADDPLMSSPAEITLEDWRSGNNAWVVHVPLKNLMEYMIQALCWQRVSMLEDVGDGFSGVDYWMKHVYLFDGVRETLAGDTKVGFEQQKMFDLLTMKYDRSSAALNEELAAKEHQVARDLIWYLLTSSSMLKISRGPGLTRDKGFGSLLDEPENKHKHCEPGTFFELLRSGSLHFKQTRDEINEVAPPEPTVTLRKGLTEL